VVPVFRAFRAFLTQIYYWGPRTTVLEASADVEKGISITESQQRGTAHIHPLSVNSTVALNFSGIRDDHVNSQAVSHLYRVLVLFILIMPPQYISCDTPTSLYRDDLSDLSFSSMPPLEWPGSTPSGSSDVFVLLTFDSYLRLTFSCSL
jgi:hypothetical protein